MSDCKQLIWAKIRSQHVTLIACRMVNIRPYYPDDLEAIIQLWWRTWHLTFPDLQHPQPYTLWKTRFQDDIAVRGLIWVAELENQIVGFAVVVKKQGCLEQIFVDTAYQHQGVGSLLLNKVKEICPQGLTLHTLLCNTPARTFYGRHDFRAGKLGINKTNGLPNVEYHWSPS